MIRTLNPTLAIRQTIGYFGVMIAIGFYIACLGPTLPNLASNTGSSLEQISILFSARAFGYLLGSLTIGQLYDRVAGHRMLALIMILAGGMMALVPVLSTLWILALVLLVLGIGEGGVDVGSNTLLVWVHGKKVGPFMNALHFFFGLGAFLSPVIIAQTLLLSGDIKLGYWLLAIYALPVAAWFLRTPAPAGAQSKPDQNNPVLNVGLLVWIAVFFFLYVSAEASFGGWIFTYATAAGLGDANSAAYLTSVFWAAFTAGRLLGIPLATRLKPSSMILSDLFGCLVGMSILIIWSESVPALWIGSVLVGISMASLFPTMLVLAERRMQLTGRVTRWFFVGAGLGGMFLPWVIGQFFVSWGPQVTLYFILADLLLVLGVSLLILRYPKLNSLASPA